MIIRTKTGNVLADTSSVLCNATALLGYLGVKKETEGIHTITGDVELIASVPFCLSAENEVNNGIMWTLSTFDLDRYGERIDPAGWDFAQYMKNPVIEWAHRYDIPAIGKMDGLTVDSNGLHGFVFFNPKDFDPFGWSIGERVKAGVIRAGSVGFRVLEIEIPSKDASRDGTSLIFRKQELLEFSICNVPANPFALAKVMSNDQSPTKLAIAMSKGENGVSDNFWGGLFHGATGNDSHC